MPLDQLGALGTDAAPVVGEVRALFDRGHVECDLVAAHPTLQLPAVVAVTNLETGRTLRVRVIERGPDRAGRVIAVSPRAAAAAFSRSRDRGGRRTERTAGMVASVIVQAPSCAIMLACARM